MRGSSLQRGLTVATLALAVVALFAVAFVDEGGGSGGGRGVSGRVRSAGGVAPPAGRRLSVQLVAATTEGAGSARVELRCDPGAPFGAVTGDGAFDFDRRAGRLTLATERFSMEERLVGDTVYLSIPEGALPVGTPWLGFSLPGGAVDRGAALLSPGAVVDSLRAAGEIEPVGADTIRGVETTHYRAVPSAEPARTVDLWVDALGRLRRLEYGVAGAGEAPPPGPPRPAVVLDLFDYGVSVGSVEVPPASAVTSLPAIAAGPH